MAERMKTLERERKQNNMALEDKRSKLQEMESQRLLGTTQKFTSETASKAKEMLKVEVVGLQTMADYQRKRSFLSSGGAQGEEAALYLERQRKDEKKKMSATPPTELKRNNTSSLSFGDEIDEQEVEEEAAKKPRVRKDPTAETDFLPDPERDARRLKQLEEKMYKEQQLQERQKAQLIEVPVNYYDGNDHRRSIQIRQGAYVADLLDLARREIAEIRGVSLDNLLFVKNDHVVPNHLTFYELIESKHYHRGVTLFDWDTTPKDKLALHPSFIAERTWYLQNMHLSPAKNWRPYDSKSFAEVQDIDDPFVKVFKACDKKVTELPKIQRPK